MTSIGGGRGREASRDRPVAAAPQTPEQAEQARQRGVILWFAGVLTIASVTYIPIYLRDQLPAVASLLVVLSVLGGAMWVAQWRVRRPLQPVIHMIVGFTWLAISASAWMRAGHYWDPVIEWLLLVPLIAATLMGPGWVVFWTAAAIASTVLLWVYRDPAPVAVAARGQWLLLDRVGALVVVAIVTSAWARLRQHTLSELTRYSARLDRTLRLRDDMIAQISHAFRTPLTTMTGVAEQLQGEADASKRTELLDAADTLLALVENLMLLTDPELSDGSSTREFAPQRLAGRVRNLLQDSTADRRDVMELLAIPEGTVIGPARVLERALIWIGASALEATEQRPALRLQVVAGEGRQRWMLSGAGIRAIAPTIEGLTTDQTSLVTPAGSRRSELYLAVRMLQNAGVVICHEPPALVLDVPVCAAGASRAAPLMAGRALVAEDHPVNRRIIEELLLSAGWDVRAVGDGAALIAAMNEPYDLLVVDCEMPVLDGIQAVEKIRADGFDGAIVMLTAHASAEIRRRALDAGADAVMIKPLRLDRLADLLATVRTGRRVAPALDAKTDSPGAAAVIDREAFDFVRGLPDGADLVRRFRLEAERRMVVGSDPAVGSTERIEAWHSLKGAAVSLGFAGLGSAAAACEDTMRRSGDLPETLLAAVRGAWRDVCVWLDQSGGAAETPPGDFADQEQDADQPEPR
ncbi:MAG: response regulator [Candidatus Dadabacteria bacterium]|nr:MAG: response regulator [Candidatus Dadabacteria bacterium]